MAAVDPYSPCPCGSGQKFKWCCQKVEAQADRAQRLFENGQADLAIEALDEGLRKEPGNPWLLTRKAIFEIRQGRVEPAKATLRRVLERQPKHFGALILMTRLVLETEGPVAGTEQLQRALAAAPAESRKDLASLVRTVGSYLGETGFFPAALKHLKLAIDLGGDRESASGSGIRLIEGNPSIPPWMKNPDALLPPPAGLAASAHERFAEALRWAEEGLWSAAAAAFEILTSDKSAAVAADRNLGLCRLWLADNDAAATALRRHLARLGATPEAVDLEALCQQIAPPRADDLVEHVQLIWPLRDRQGLLTLLRADKSVHEEGPGPIDPADPESPEVDQFGLLDRPAITRSNGLRAEDMPRFVGRVLVGQEIVALETYDDGRLDALGDRFTAMAGKSIRPAHPRTKVLDKASRVTMALSWDWFLPEGMEPAEVDRLNLEQGAKLISEVWPRTPMPFLGGRTPLQAAKSGGAEIPLRAAVFQLQQTRDVWRDAVDFAGLRATLKIEPEPAIDPLTVDVDQLHVARLVLVPVESLDDDRLIALYRRSRRAMIAEVLERTARALVERPTVRERAAIDSMMVHSDLASISAARGDLETAFDWVRRGRQADPVPQRAKNAPLWDMLEVRLKSRREPPETWVPDLAVVLDRYADDAASNQSILMNLLDMGLIEIVPNPDKPGEILVDSRHLQALLAEYGPRVTTASGQLGVSASKGEIWTPGASKGGGGAIWTPGSPTGAPAAAGQKPRLIVPGS